MRWCLIIEEYGPELIYVKGENNIVADALSRLPTIQNISTDAEAQTMEMHEMAELFGQDDLDLPESAFPLTYKLITKYQKEDKELLKLLQDNDQFYIKTFHGGGKIR